MTTLGLFVGGRATRMGGAPKGLLPAPDTGESLVFRAVRLAREAGLAVCLVGDASAYVSALREVPVVDDDPAGLGPLGGLRALLRAREGRVIALACDMPFVTLDDLATLRDAPDDADVVAPRRASDAPWEPLLARYDCARALPAVDAALAAGERSLQSVLRRLRVTTLALPALALTDWDAPSDLPPR